MWQPWATLFAHGEKRVETRSWPCKPGWTAIHAAKKRTRELDRLRERPEFRTALERCGYTSLRELPYGAIVGAVYIDRAEQMNAASSLPTHVLDSTERAFGLYEPGRYGWIATVGIPLLVPIPLKGRRGFFALPSDVAAEVTRALHSATS
jgi:hypothetical protein